MYNFQTNTLTLQGKEAPIAKFGVEFATPWGIVPNLDEAVNLCSELDVDPTVVVQPVVVIYDDAGRSEIFVRHT